MNVKHVEAQQHILDAVCHIVDRAGETQNVFALQGSDEFPDQLFHCLVFGQIGLVLQLVHGINLLI